MPAPAGTGAPAQTGHRNHHGFASEPAPEPFPFKPRCLMLRANLKDAMRRGMMTSFKTLAGACAVALMAFVAVPAGAQTMPPPYGPPIPLDTARKVMTAAEAEAAKNNWPVVIAILDSGGNVVMLIRRDDTQLASLELAVGKAKTSLIFKRPTKVLDDAISSGGAGIRFLALKDITPLEGGFPLVMDGKIVGAIGVSGVMSAQNAQIGRAGVDVLK
jgi:glc operon protein GlcG